MQTTNPTAEDDDPTETPRELARKVPRRGSLPPDDATDDPDTDDGRALARRIPRRH